MDLSIMESVKSRLIFSRDYTFSLKRYYLNCIYYYRYLQLKPINNYTSINIFVNFE